MIQRNTTQLKKKQGSRIELHVGMIDKYMYIYRGFRDLKAFTLYKTKPNHKTSSVLAT